MKNTSPIYPDLKVGTRLRRTYTDRRGVRLIGKVVGFHDEIDTDAMDAGASEEEATLPGGAVVLELDKVCRPRFIGDDGSTSELVEHIIYSDEILAEDDWEVVA